MGENFQSGGPLVCICSCLSAKLTRTLPTVCWQPGVPTTTKRRPSCLWLRKKRTTCVTSASSSTTSRSPSCRCSDGVEIAVVYYRTAYAPQQMDAKSWEVRLRIELSRAIKCPSVQYHLAGTKKVQQVLAQPGVLDRFFTNKGITDSVRATFTGLYSLDLTPEGHKAALEGINNPNKYVLKPQREGGGNNVYGEDVRTKLKELGRTKAREGYILMELIEPPVTTNYIVRPGGVMERHSIVSELGIFGVILGDQDDILHNSEAGHILRTKAKGTSEGGICAGFAALDGIYLV